MESVFDDPASSDHYSPVVPVVSTLSRSLTALHAHGKLADVRDAIRKPKPNLLRRPQRRKLSQRRKQPPRRQPRPTLKPKRNLLLQKSGPNRTQRMRIRPRRMGLCTMLRSFPQRHQVPKSRRELRKLKSRPQSRFKKWTTRLWDLMAQANRSLRNQPVLQINTRR